MKEFLDIMMKDIQEENFTRKEYIVYGIITPLSLIALMALGGWLERL